MGFNGIKWIEWDLMGDLMGFKWDLVRFNGIYGDV